MGSQWMAETLDQPFVPCTVGIRRHPPFGDIYEGGTAAPFVPKDNGNPG